MTKYRCQIDGADYLTAESPSKKRCLEVSITTATEGESDDKPVILTHDQVDRLIAELQAIMNTQRNT